MKDYQKIAVERIKILFNEAAKAFKKHPERSHRYVALARKIAMKTKVKVPKNLKRKFCSHCYKFLQPGVNCRVRTRNKKLIYFCFSCRRFMRIPLLQRSNNSSPSA